MNATKSKSRKALIETKLLTYVGGQMEIQNKVEGYLYRGEIKEISLVNLAREEDSDNLRGFDLRVKFTWLAKNEFSNGLPTGRWVRDRKPECAFSLLIYQVSDIGEGRTALYSYITNELVVLYPKGGSKIECPLRMD